MITILAEKNSVARKIAAALDGIKLDDGTVVTFNQLSKYEKAVQSIQAKKGFIPIRFMGQECCVTHAVGHLCALWDAADYDEDYKQWKNIELPFIPSFYGLKVVPQTSHQFKIIKNLFDKSNLIINATDSDREGELIFAYIYEKCKCKVPYKRALFSATTEEDYINAFNNLKNSDEMKDVENAGRCRAIADWLIGINCTVATTLSSHANSVISIGRVQTPTLSMIVDREKAIRNFKVETYYTPFATFTTTSGETYTGENKTKFNSKLEAAGFLSALSGKAKITSVDRKLEKAPNPSLYNLSLLQIEANKKFGFTAEETLNITQNLYEKGFVTYPRTDSAFLPDDYKPTADRVLSALAMLPEYSAFIMGKPKIYQDKYFDSKKVDSHSAIVPTHVVGEKLSENEQKIYDLICRSLIMTIYSPAEIEKVKVITTDNEVEFVSRGSVVIKKGWMEVAGASKDKFLPNLIENSFVTGEYEAQEKNTEPPKRYTDASLITAMEAADKDADDADLKSLTELKRKGIGTPATRAATIELLSKRHYIERVKKSIIPTEKGISLIDALPLEDIKSAKLTASWENRLYDVEKGKEDSKRFVSDIEDLTREWCKTILSEMKTNLSSESGVSNPTESKLKCPLCGSPVKKVPWGYGCSGYKSGCKFSIGQTLCGKKLTDKQIETLIEKKETREIKGFVSKKTGKEFSAKLMLSDDGKVSFRFE